MSETVTQPESHMAPPTQPAKGLLDYLEIVVKRRNMIFFSTLIAALISILISLTTTRIYTATTRILPPQQDSGLLAGMLGQMTGGMSNVAGDLLGKGNQSDLYAKILATEAIQDPIIDRFNMLESDRSKKTYRIFLYEALAKKVAISVGKKDGMITISVDDKNPKRAANIANAYVDELGKLIVRYNIESYSQSRIFIEQQLAKTKNALVSAETNLKNFQTKHKIYDVSGQVSASIGEIGNLRAQLAMQENQYAMLKAQYTDSVQEVMSVKAAISKLRVQIANQEGNRSGSSIPTVGSVPVLGEEYIRLLREFKIQEAMNEVLTKQYEMIKFSEAKNISTIQVIQAARIPDKSIKPSRRKLVLRSTIMIFSLSILFAVYLEQMSSDNMRQIQRFRELCKQLCSLKTL